MAATASNTSSPDWNPSSPYVTMVAQVCMFVAIATVNVLTLVVMAMTPRLQTIPNTYITSLAVSDLVVSVNQLIAIPWTYPASHGYFEAHPALCMFFKCLLHVNELTSIFTIVLIGVDRFLYIRHPFWYLRVVTKSKVKTAIVLAWVASFVTAIPIRVAPSEQKYPGCDAKALLYDSGVAGYVHGVLFFLLCFTLFLSYGIVIRTAVKQTRAIRATQTHNISITDAETSVYETNTHNLPSLQTVAPKKRRRESNLEAKLSLKIVQKMAGVFVVLFVCWTPYILIGLIGPTKVKQELVLLTGFLAAFNSAANFAVYALGDREFRGAIAKLLCCRNEIGVSSPKTVCEE
ncbi:beta-3 adrenergic receptor-like [Littorina saxatilis]|uniref:beta-3 adrenergic receptor-like n=1 Tax=Littorina saxatilis TaxID=31220 RepID=UPI0038B4CF2B